MSFSLHLNKQESEFVARHGGEQWLQTVVRQKMAEWSIAYKEIVPNGYQVCFDDDLARIHIPRVSEYDDTKDPTELEAIYYRIVKQASQSCIEYIYYWNFQALPPHSYDYEPIYVYLINEKVDRVAFDVIHYIARVFQGNPPFTIWGLWHGFLSLRKARKDALDRPLIQLDDAVLGKWYNRKSKAMFEIRQKLADPWQVLDNSTFRDEPVLPGAKYKTATRQLMELDEKIRGGMNRELLAATRRNIDALYRSGIKTATISKLLPKERKTPRNLESIKLQIRDTRSDIIEHLRQSGYVDVKKGHAVWTHEGERYRKLLEENMTPEELGEDLINKS